MKTFASLNPYTVGVDEDVYYNAGVNYMANRRTSLEEKYDLLLECRKSGLSDRDWCFSKGIPQSTFYLWLRKLRAAACYEIPETASDNTIKGAVLKQDVVKLNLYQDASSHEIRMISASDIPHASKPPILIEIEGVKLSVENNADPALLAQTLKMLRGLLC